MSKKVFTFQRLTFDRQIQHSFPSHQHQYQSLYELLYHEKLITIRLKVEQS